MADHWGFVLAAYGIAAVALAAYWRRLVRLERETPVAGAGRQGAGAAPSGGRR
jgi:hypothetical protein